MNLIRFVICLACLVMMSCSQSGKRNRVVVIQPFADFDPALTKRIHTQVKTLFNATLLKEPIVLPEEAYYAPRNRYRADTLIRRLKDLGSADTVIIGLTSKDISTTKGAHKDWGIMGLAYRPGNSCVVSSFRLAKKNLSEQFYKVAVHELGHTQGLPHCPVKTCFMRDAEGGNPLNEEKDFCTSCKSFLTSRGWKFR